MKGPLFYSKILLFGEYGIIQDSKGLSIPYNFYNGALKTDKNSSEEAKKSNENLKRFVTYLETLRKLEIRGEQIAQIVMRGLQNVIFQFELLKENSQTMSSIYSG